MYGLNDYIIIDLKTAINLGKSARAVCLPRVSNGSASIVEEDLNSFYSANSTVVVGGWKKYLEFHNNFLTLKLESDEHCEMDLRRRTRTTPSEFPYRDRVCGYISERNVTTSIH